MSKIISIKISEELFEDVERVIDEQNISRNAYITQAIKFMNRIYKRRNLKRTLRKESRLLQKESMHVLREFDDFLDEGL